MKDVIVQIKHVATGEVVEFTHPLTYNEETKTFEYFVFEDGNFACDCNRAIFFDRYSGREVKDLDTYECSVGVYRVNLINPDTGEVFYREF